MDNYRKTVKKRIALFSVTTLVALVLGGYQIILSRQTEGRILNEVISGFQSGLIFAIGVLSTLQLIRLIRIYKDERQMKIYYNHEKDERMNAIRVKAGMPMLLITSSIMIIAAVIAGYYNIIVFYTLVITAMTQLSLGAALKIYFSRTM